MTKAAPKKSPAKQIKPQFDLTKERAGFLKEYLEGLSFNRAAHLSGFLCEKPDGYYVYFLVDPISDEIFYIGKGKGKRIHSHAKQYSNNVIDNANKFERIKSIHTLGQKVTEVVFQSGLSDEDAYKLERLLIKELMHTGITNISHGCSTNAEKSKVMVKHMKSRLKPYESWIRSLDSERLRIVEHISGSAKQFYSEFVDALDRVEDKLCLQ